MSFDTGIFTDLDDSASIADPMVLVRAAAIKPPANMGRFWEDCPIEPDPESNRKFSIFSRTETPQSGTIGTGGWDDSATTALPVTDATGLVKGLVLNVAGEYVVVTSVNTGSTPNTIAVRARGAAGTTAATHLAAVEYTVVGSAIDDIDLKDVTSIHESTNEYENYMQTMAEPIDYTKGGILDPRKGLSDNQIRIMEEEAMMRVAKKIYTTSVLGKKAAKTSTSPWLTAGLLQQLSDTTGGRLVQTYAVGGVLTEAKLRAALRIAFERGNPNTMYVSSANKDTINGFLASSSATKVSVGTDLTNTVAGYYVDSYNYEGNIIDIKIDLSIPDDQIPIVDISKCKKGWKQGDSLALEKQPTQSTREFRSAYNGSFFLAVEDVGYAHILLTGITQS